jgi:hypothetical protein
MTLAAVAEIGIVDAKKTSYGPSRAKVQRVNTPWWQTKSMLLKSATL